MSALDLLVGGALATLALAMAVAMARVAVGPTEADRALAVDLGFAVFVAGAAVLSVWLDEPLLVTLVLVATLVGFLATVALAMLVARRPS